MPNGTASARVATSAAGHKPNGEVAELCLMGHSRGMEIRQTRDFRVWMTGLSDRRARARVADRIDRLRHGNPGDVRPVGEGISELRIDHGPGYRVYFTRYGATVLLLLVGGDKRTQPRDIAKAKALAKEWNADR